MKTAPVLIGGAARNGKSMLAGMIGQAFPLCWGSPFELLLNVQPSRAARTKAARRSVLTNYMMARRSTSADHLRTAGPSDFLNSDERAKTIENAVSRGGIVSGIAVILDRIAESQGAGRWVGADYHCECDFEALRRFIPNLHLVIVIRDPVEAVAASIYWRTFPDRINAAKRELLVRIAFWKLSAAVALRLATLFPKKVLILDIHEIWAGKEKAIDCLATFLGYERVQTSDVFVCKPWFSRDSRNEFLCPDGKKRALLSDDEIASIERATASLLHILRCGEGQPSAGLRLAASLPRLARTAIAVWHRPYNRVMRTISRLRRIARLLTTV